MLRMRFWIVQGSSCLFEECAAVPNLTVYKTHDVPMFVKHTTCTFPLCLPVKGDSPSKVSFGTILVKKNKEKNRTKVCLASRSGDINKLSLKACNAPGHPFNVDIAFSEDGSQLSPFTHIRLARSPWHRLGGIE